MALIRYWSPSVAFSAKIGTVFSGGDFQPSRGLRLTSRGSKTSRSRAACPAQDSRLNHRMAVVGMVWPAILSSASFLLKYPPASGDRQGSNPFGATVAAALAVRAEGCAARQPVESPAAPGVAVNHGLRPQSSCLSDAAAPLPIRHLPESPSVRWACAPHIPVRTLTKHTNQNRQTV